MCIPPFRNHNKLVGNRANESVRVLCHELKKGKRENSRSSSSCSSKRRTCSLLSCSVLVILHTTKITDSASQAHVPSRPLFCFTARLWFVAAAVMPPLYSSGFIVFDIASQGVVRLSPVFLHSRNNHQRRRVRTAPSTAVCRKAARLQFWLMPPQ